MNNNTFIATVDDDTIYAIDSSSRERTEVGIIHKSARRTYQCYRLAENAKMMEILAAKQCELYHA